MGMAHRGRLNVLANILRKPYEEIFAEFEENFLPDSMDGDGDVKYHLGFSSDRVNYAAASKSICRSRPTRATWKRSIRWWKAARGPSRRCSATPSASTACPLLVHGDAAFAGQGLVAETLNLSQLPGYAPAARSTSSSTTRSASRPRRSDARSTTYCTDVAKMIQVPIFHVNGEDPEAAVYVAELALEFRQTFNRDVVIDMFCYRKHGHNEGDEPAYTQPLHVQQDPRSARR